MRNRVGDTHLHIRKAGADIKKMNTISEKRRARSTVIVSTGLVQ